MNSCEFWTTPCVIILCRTNAEFFRKLIFPSYSWLVEFEGCVNIEWTFFSIASFSTENSSQSFGLIGWWRSYVNVFLVCLAVFVEINLDKPFSITEIDGYTLVFGFWSHKWMEILNVDQNRKFDSAMCWLLQNLRRWEMANF